MAFLLGTPTKIGEDLAPVFPPPPHPDAMPVRVMTLMSIIYVLYLLFCLHKLSVFLNSTDADRFLFD